MKNPKVKIGLAALAGLVVLGILLAVRMVPTVRETRREMSLTPTPEPPAEKTLIEIRSLVSGVARVVIEPAGILLKVLKVSTVKDWSYYPVKEHPC